MKKRHLVRKSESGQAIVLLTFGIITLLAFFALAVDGGMYYSERRDAQGAADSAALTAALAICAGEDAVDAAEFIADANGYDNDGTTNIVTVYEPPANGYYAGQENYVEVVITTNIRGTVTSLVGDSILESTVHAIGYCGSTGSSSSVTVHPTIKNAGVVLLQEDGNSLHMNSNGYIIVQSGTLFINSSHSQAMTLDSNAHLWGGEVNIVGGYTYNANPDITGTINTGATAVDPAAVFPDLVPPDKPTGSCQTITVDSNKSKTIDPGLYCGININSNGTLTLNSGIYWFQSGGINVNSNANFIADSGVLLYFGPSAGALHQNSNTTVNIVPLQTGPYAGLAYYQNNSTQMTLDSNADFTSLSGTFYLPTANFTVNSNGDFILEAQVIANRVIVNSNGRIYVNLGDSILYGADDEVLSVSLAE